jgi:hypothetical protein
MDPDQFKQLIDTLMAIKSDIGILIFINAWMWLLGSCSG